MFRVIFFAFFLTPCITLAAPCKVVGVSDGDTFTCLTDENDQVKVRLAEIDAPEMDQPYGSRSKQALSDLIYSEFVKLSVQDTDRYGRTVARITRADGVDVNAEQVRAGAAWAYTKYLKDKSLLILEAEAKNSHRGLWALPTSDQMPPWEWRNAKRSGAVVAVPAQEPAQPKRQTSYSQAGSVGGSFNCNTIKWCSQMSSCAEAKYQLTQCGNPKIDGDRDGIPCESMCR